MTKEAVRGSLVKVQSMMRNIDIVAMAMRRPAHDTSHHVDAKIDELPASGAPLAVTKAALQDESIVMSVVVSTG